MYESFVQKDYLIRTRDEMDHRIILLSVSQKAKKVLKTHDKFHSDILGMVLDSMTFTSNESDESIRFCNRGLL